MIGVFDSGIGGVTALKELLRLMPQESYIYFADEAHCPYGIRSRTDICRYTAAAVSFFTEKGCDRVLFACGTASALSLDFCRKNFPLPIHGVIEPTVQAAAVASKSRRIAIAATEATVKDGRYETLLRLYAPDATLFAIPCAPLVPLAECGARQEEVFAAVKSCLAPLRYAKPDVLILGCTHFSLLQSAIRAFLPDITMIDSAAQGAAALCAAHTPLKNKKGTPSLHLYTTKDRATFSRRASAILGKKVTARQAPHSI